MNSVPEETAGPFPADGSNGPDVLSESGVVRRDITKSFGSASGTAAGVPTTIELTLLDVAGGGGPLAGAAVYLWHCDRAGGYSLYDPAVADQNYLRGVQVSDGERQALVRLDLPRRVFRALAAHPFRGLREPRRGHVELREAPDVADRIAEGRLRCRLRVRRGLRAVGYEPLADVA